MHTGLVLQFVWQERFCFTVCQTDEEKVKVFVEIAKQAFGGPQYDYDVYLKKK